MNENELKKHKKYMLRCIEIAKRNSSNHYPNPSVGALVLKNDIIISEGVTSDYGGNHAEVNAIKPLQNKTDLSNAILYVTLEPCSHHGKTPPCTELIYKSGIKNVIIGALDISSKVNGKGISYLKTKGINVISGVCMDKCNQLHKNFLHYNKHKRPYIILKWAKSKDQFIAPLKKDDNRPFLISSNKSRQLVHKWRSEEHSILVGYNTVIDDNPTLDVRHVNGNNPVRIVLDDKKSLKNDFNIFNDVSETISINYYLKNKNPAKFICKKLFEKNIQSVIIEGGKKTLDLFINENLWDEARVFESNTIINSGIKSPKLNGTILIEQKVGDDMLKIFKPN